ncbi:hypothetical protein Tco_1140919 [Tanacetum coccineum]
MANLDFCDKHNMVAYLQKSEGSEGFHQIIDFLTTSHIRYALTESLTIYVSLIEQFWQTASASTLENGDMEIAATIDGKVKVVSEASIRRHLKLEDYDGISTLPTSEIFEQLALIGYGRILQGKGSTIPVESLHIPISAPSTSQPPTLPPSMQTTHVAEEAATMPHDSPLLRVHLLGSDEGSQLMNMKECSKDELSQEQLQQLMIIVPEEGMNVEALQTKYPIIDWEVYTKDSRKYWKIIRVGNHTEVYKIFEDMLKNFDKDDLVKLWSLVHERFNSTEPTKDKERELWVELKRLFELNDDDTL